MTNDFDVIVIGSGIGGLISAGILASHGLQPLVIEKNIKTGGYLSTFKRKNFSFDSAVDCIAGVGQDGLITSVMSSLGVDHELELIHVDPIRVSMFPGLEIPVDRDLKQYRERLIQLFPSEVHSIKAFLDTARNIYEVILSSLTHSDTSGFHNISPEIVKYSACTYSDFLNEFINDEKLKTLLSDRCPFIGLPPSKVSALSMVALMMSYFKFGAYRVKGGFQKLADLLAEGIKKKGGTIITGQKVNRILIKNDMCQGITCMNGEHYRCRYLISNIDFFSTWNTLIGDKYSAYAQERLKYPGISASFFLIYAGIKDDLAIHSSLGYFTSYDIESFFKPDSALKNDFTLGITASSQEDSTRAPQGYQTVVIHDMFYNTGKKFNKTEYFDKIMKRAEKIIPSFRDRTVVIDTATPSTLEKYTGNYKGAAFGWKQIPGFTNLKNQGIGNLSFAGHWGTMGGGVLAAAYSGAQAAQKILKKEGIKYCV